MRKEGAGRCTPASTATRGSPSAPHTNGHDSFVVHEGYGLPQQMPHPMGRAAARSVDARGACEAHPCL